MIRKRGTPLVLGGWANPHADAEAQVRYLLDPTFSAEFYLTQIVSHHDTREVERFLKTADRSGVTVPGVFGVFYYRSANAQTLRTLRQFLPVPAEGLQADFAQGATPQEICARTLRTLTELGARHFYISNLPLSRASRTLGEILELVRVAA